ncbi:phosphate ABC transporter substrate-binding protein (PhoT family) [Natranaerovirga hydrolytica]|uniref:Phosphate-binding protein n=1 Tax=Natranaerovirga hydrolytica TaxID=680378 RepID=A0A4R1N001_9FIRM|nr:phosphate ABC transporter substrate-binding protein [Natranaerovirga hydrolytica]TCK98785.1 phosphate ABC transporter substrate-binding protein (PhoT family) [Natranaerovirga hydrolytica]
MKNLKVLLSLILVIVMVGAFAGCSDGTNNADANSNVEQNNNQSNNENNDKDVNDEEELSGTVTISGSTSVEPVGIGIAEEFMAFNPNVIVTYEGLGSSAGITNGNERVTNIGATSRGLRDNEKEFGLVEAVVAYDGIALITHPDNPIEDLTREDVQKIYLGEATNWSEFGGNDEEIVVVSREAGSGTRGAFEEIVDFEDQLTSNAIIAEGNGNVQSTVAENPQSIGYVSFTYINDTVKPVPIAGALPTVENVQNESYTIARPFIMVYHEDNLNDVSKAYMEFALSNEGQKIVEEVGAIPVN